jgi:group I intron endonuclease
MIGIYKIINPKGKIYIGQSVNIEKRWYVYKNKINLDIKLIGVKLFRSLTKYTSDKHEFSILEECSLEQLNEREIYWINYYESINKGLNIKEGGSRGKHNPETIELIRNKAIGRKLSTEAKEKISKSKIGNKYNLGRKHSDEIKQQDIYKNRKKGKITLERNEKIKLKLEKPVVQLDINNNFIKEWKSIKEATTILSLNSGDVSKCCNNKQKTCYGYKWKFKCNYTNLS